ncbi:hypothetical protein NXS19_003989 [Fusarium pseudograminearum]|nr:hypothetical protein NXS19_003989 [Fusarium pseudograminearum]
MFAGLARDVYLLESGWCLRDNPPHGNIAEFVSAALQGEYFIWTHFTNRIAHSYMLLYKSIRQATNDVSFSSELSPSRYQRKLPSRHSWRAPGLVDNDFNISDRFNFIQRLASHYSDSDIENTWRYLLAITLYT